MDFKIAGFLFLCVALVALAEEDERPPHPGWKRGMRPPCLPMHNCKKYHKDFATKFRAMKHPKREGETESEGVSCDWKTEGHEACIQMFTMKIKEMIDPPDSGCIAEVKNLYGLD